jgi:hyaluronoglucosaminidase
MFANEETSGWVAVREIELNVLDDNTPLVTYSNIGNIYKGALLNIVDNDDDSFCFFDTNVTEGSYIQIDYLTSNTVKGINILFGTGVTEGLNDKFVGELQYSLDGENWTKIADMNDLEIHIDLTSNPLSFRYLRMYAPNYQPGWVAVRTVALVIDN